MRHLLPAHFVMILAVSLLAQTSPPSGKTTAHPEPSCVVSGRVVSAVDGSPLKSAKVTMVPETEWKKSQLYAVTTDSDGRFSLKDVVAGRYNFAANHTGFVTQYYKTTGTDEGALLWLRPGEQIGDVLFRMVLSGVITGRLLNEDSDPMVAAQVVALAEPSQESLEDKGASSETNKLQAVASAQTDDRGQYRIYGLSPGEYYLKAADSSEPDPNGLANQAFWLREELGSEYAPAFYPGVSQAGQAQAIPVKAGEEVQADFFMRRSRTAKIPGLVMGKDGPAGSTWVRLGYAGEYDSGGERQTTTDEKGRFEIEGVPPGTYLISALQKRDANGIYEIRGQQKVEVNGENVDSLVISIGAGSSLQGRNTVEGASSPKLERIGVALTRLDDDEQFGAEGRVNKDGTFEIKSVSDGTYGITLCCFESKWYIKSVRLGGADLLETGLQVEKGAPGGKIEVVIGSAGAQLAGSVSDDNTAVAGANVRVIPEPETPYNRFRAQSLRTDQTGHFLFIGLAPGKYRVLARYGSSAEGGVLRSEPEIITLSERDHKTIQLAATKRQDQ
jgi:5-hydroxyisourate hydrolase-like protein (transthyretin family)